MGFGIIILFIIFLSSVSDVYCANAKKASLPAVLKADKIDSNQTEGSNVVNAVGNVELTKDSNTLFSDLLSYDKNSQNISAKGNIRIKNYDIGNLLAKTANVKSDFKSGEFSDATIIFHDGSYIKSPKITRVNESKTIFSTPIFSICPNDEIKDDNLFAGKKRDLFSITSTKTTINKLDNSIKTKNGVIRLYNFPIFYTPYLKTPIPSRKRKSGFLYPSYLNNTRLGVGVKIPYYFNIAPNKDLTTTLRTYPSNGHLILNNKYRHLIKQGQYNIDLALANNKPKTNNIINYKESTKSIRWKLESDGSFEMPKDLGLDFKINYVGDKDYLRDYGNQFDDYTISEAKLDYIKNKDYASLKTVEIQDLTLDNDGSESLTALPIIDYYTETKPKNGWFNQTYSLLSNSTIITKGGGGAQYRRLVLKPEIKIPYDLNGNLFEFATNIQGNFYSLNNNYQQYQNSNGGAVANYRPETIAKWSFPMVSTQSNRTLILEPLITIATSSSYNNNNLPNQDSNNTELTQSNLFLGDRITGFDRSETGKRVSYGFKSTLFNKLGEFNLGLGQGWHKTQQSQDVIVKGFSSNGKSNIVGDLAYKSPKIFSIIYNFQLNESNYRDDISQISTNLNFKRVRFDSSYLFITNFDANQPMKQISFGLSIDITKKLVFNNNVVNDLITDRRISRTHSLNYNGCCVIYGLTFSEESPSILMKSNKSFSINFVIKNL